MTWRDELRRVRLPDGRTAIGGSFRGVPFLVESVERAGGRRIVAHEFPFRDDPYVEDLGKRGGTYRVEGYVIGDDYLSQKNALLDALESEGPGELVLPFYGTLRAIGETQSVSETKDDGGIARFSIQFVETPLQPPVPTRVVNDTDLVDAGADAAAAASDAELVEQFDTDLPSFAFESAEAAITKAADALSDKLAPIVNATQELATLTGQLALLTTEAASLARAPADAVAAFRDAITGLAETAEDAPEAVWAALSDAYDVDLGDLLSPVVATTPTRAAELANQTALCGALRRVLAVEAARLAPLVTYETLEDALAARDRVAAMLEEQAQTAGDTAYPALVDLRSQVLRAVPGSQVFARVVTVTRKTPVPAVVLAYQLYGEVAENDADIVARNGVRHPGFVSGDVKVLSDG